MAFDGDVLAEQSFRLDVAGLGSQFCDLPSDLTCPESGTSEFIVATTSAGIRAFWLFAEAKDLAYRPASLEIQSVKTSTGIQMTITSPTFVQGLCVFADRLDPAARVSEMLLTLLPGECGVIDVTGVEGEMADRLETAPVLRCLNDVVRSVNTVSP